MIHDLPIEEKEGEVESGLMKTWAILTGTVILLFTGAYFAFSFYAVSLIQPQLQKALGPWATVERVKVQTTSLSASRIQLRDPQTKQILLQAEEMRAYPSLLTPFQGGVHFRKIYLLGPSLFFYRNRDGRWIGPWMRGEWDTTGQGDSRPMKGKGA